MSMGDVATAGTVRTAWRIATLVAFPLVVATGGPARGGEAEELFTREVAPYLAERCYACHSSSGGREQDLALDWSGGLRDGGLSGPAVVPGDPEASLLVRALKHQDDLEMPKGGPAAPPEVIAAVVRWIELGAGGARDRPPTAAELAAETSWEAVSARRRRWWSLQPVVRPPVPTGPGVPADPIDAFVHQKLTAAGLESVAEADRATLIRRLSFDLIGLPPDPAEVDDFVADPAPDAYERLVERLLASPHYGERWGRHWLDAVRYTESQGFEYDHPRDNAWHYRDYVIRAFNDDLPYDQFVRQQLAGDVLEPVTRDGIVAASLLVCGPWDQAGSQQANAAQRAATREEEMEDMLAVVGQTFLGLTLNCARCHTHKFDPVSQEEYFRIKAVFDGVRHGERPIASPAEIEARSARLARLREEVAAARATVARIEADGTRLALANRGEAAAAPAGPAPLVRFVFDGQSAAVAAGTLAGAAVIRDGKLMLSRSGGSYFQSGPIDRDITAKTLESWVELADLDQGGGAAVALENEPDRDFDAIVFGERQPRKWVPGSGGFARTRDLEAEPEAAPPGTLVQMVITYSADGTITTYRNGVPYGSPYTPAPHPRTYRAGEARVLVGLRHHGAGNGFLDGAVRQAALYDRALSAEEVAAAYASGGFTVPEAEMLAALDEPAREERREAIAVAAALEAEIAAEQPVPVSYVGLRQQPEPTRIFARGDVTKPGEQVAPGVIAAVGLGSDLAVASDAPEADRRRAFAAWVTDPANPLTPRVLVNRVWQLHFGQGFVSTPNDFGASGGQPTHPELLDWLAAEFVARGFRIKELHRLIVRSATYRRSSSSSPAAVAVDADNQLVWRFAPRRLEAEAVRDAMLAVSGALNPAIGGPSFRPFTTSRYGATFYHPFDSDAPEFNRRTVYRMNINSGKEPLLDVFDCPDPAVKTPKRGVTITPLQALGLMNNPFVQRQADRLAARCLAETNDDLEAAVRLAYRRAFGRGPAPDELAQAVAAARDRGLASVCWALLNATEFVYVR